MRGSGVMTASRVGARLMRTSLASAFPDIVRRRYFSTYFVPHYSKIGFGGSALPRSPSLPSQGMKGWMWICDALCKLLSSTLFLHLAANRFDLPKILNEWGKFQVCLCLQPLYDHIVNNRAAAYGP